MTTGPLRTRTSTLDIYIKLAQFPILADKIRVRMREEMFRRGIISEEAFEKEVERKAVESQAREGIFDPFQKEPPAVWQRRKNRIRAHLTDFYFGYNLPPERFDQLVLEALHDQPAHLEEVDLTFNPELAPWSMLFEQGEIYERLPPPQREQINHHLQEIKVVLIKGMVSDQLPFIGVAKRVLTVEDLQLIYNRRIGDGKIGGKAAGMILAWKILQQQSPASGPDVSRHIEIPDSYFLGTDVLYDFRRLNNLDHFMNEKYRTLEEIRANYPEVVRRHLQGRFPDKIVEQLREILKLLGNRPVIVRSSSLLEDNFGYSFAGKYASYFCPNSGSPDENLDHLLDAIRLIYASTGNPNAILYRQRHGLIDYDERMAVLIQAVRGHQYGRYYFPTLAGVGFSHNPFRWNPKIRREDGFLRLVWGLGTRAVDRVDRDYPRLIALSHPQLRPETTAAAQRQYSQHHIDVIDLETNEFKTLPVTELLGANYPFLRFIASEDKGDFLQSILTVGADNGDDEYVLTFDFLTRDRKFIKLMRTVLRRLEEFYKTPVDIEFTVEIVPSYPYADYRLHLLQCRPLTLRQEGGPVEIPRDIPAEDIVFTGYQLIPNGRVEGVRYVIFIDPERYRRIESHIVKLELGRIVSRLNKRLEGESFILMGPGRWGSENIDLGVKVAYADIYNTKVLIEMSVAAEDGVPELSYGTHFFQDLVEGSIYSLPLHLENPRSLFNWSFFRDSPNALGELLPHDEELCDYVRVLDVEAISGGRRLSILMDGNRDEAVCFLSSGQWESQAVGTVSSF